MQSKKEDSWKESVVVPDACCTRRRLTGSATKKCENKYAIWNAKGNKLVFSGTERAALT